MKLDRVTSGRQGYQTGLRQAEAFGHARGLAGSPRDPNPYKRPDFWRAFNRGWIAGVSIRFHNRNAGTIR